MVAQGSNKPTISYLVGEAKEIDISAV